MIIVRLQGGLGNQLFQFATGLMLSKQRGVNLNLDLGLFGQSYREFRLNLLVSDLRTIPRWRVKVLTSRILNILSKIPFFPSYHWQVRDPIWKKVNFKEDSANLALVGYWSFNSYFDEIRPLLIGLVRLNPELKSSFYNLHYQKIINSNSVGVHIRRGDYATNSEFASFFGVLDINYYRRAFTYFESIISDCTFFIFTDDPMWVKENFIFGENKVLVSNPKHFIDCQEFALMRACKHHVTANSTFSWWAAYLNDYEDRVIIQPQKWYQSEHAQKVYESNEFLFIEGAIRI